MNDQSEILKIINKLDNIIVKIDKMYNKIDEICKDVIIDEHSSSDSSDSSDLEESESEDTGNTPSRKTRTLCDNSFTSVNSYISCIEKDKPHILTPLEKRLIFYDNYYLTSIDSDEIEFFKNMAYNTKFTVYNATDFFETLKNFGLCLLPIETILETVLSKQKIIVYIPIETTQKTKHSSEDYSFYLATKVQTGSFPLFQDKTFYSLNLRLEDFALDLQDNLIEYCIYLFRKIYYDVFSDNFHRKNYKDYAQIFKEDCKQLLNNLFYLSNVKQFRKNLQTIVKKVATVEMSKNFILDLTTDDILQKQRLEKETSHSMLDIIMSRLFDDQVPIEPNELFD